jgi:hypothetical protein
MIVRSTYKNADTSNNKRLGLVMLKSAGYCVPKFDTCERLALSESTAKVLVMRSPLIMMSVADAADAYPDEWGMMYVGNTGLTKCIRMIQIGRINIQVKFENEKDWRADQGKVTDKWVNTYKNDGTFCFSCYSIDLVGIHAVSLKTGKGIISLGATEIVARKDIVRQLRVS